jgi:outer membrane protein TolC
MKPWLSIAALVVAPAVAAETGATSSATTPAVDLAALLDEAEMANPALRAAAERRFGAQHGPAQAESLPDPMVSFSFQNESLDSWTLGESQMSNITMAWSQEMPGSGKRRLAGDVARGELTVAAAAEADIRVELRSRVKAAYIELWVVDRTLAILHDNHRVLEALREVARARYESGGGTLENVLRAGAEIARLDLTIAEVAGARLRTEAVLAAVLGRTGQEPFGPARALPTVAPWDAQGLEASAVQRSTRVARARADVALELSRLEAARRETKPDWSWRAGYAERGSLDSMVVGGVGVRLPLFARNKQDQAVARSQHEVEAARLEADDVVVQLLAELRGRVAEARTAEIQRRTLEQAVLPQADAAYEAALVAYQNGQADFGTVYDNFERRLEDARVLEQVRAVYLGALARLEPLAGREIVLAGAGASHE